MDKKIFGVYLAKEGVPDTAFELLDFAKIGKTFRTGEGGVYTGGCYVVRDGELLTAPPCFRELPEKPGYLFRMTLGLHSDYGDDRTVTLDLPASEKELEEAQERLARCNGKMRCSSAMTASSPTHWSLPTCPQKWKSSTSLPKR